VDGKIDTPLLQLLRNGAGIRVACFNTVRDKNNIGRIGLVFQLLRSHAHGVREGRHAFRIDAFGKLHNPFRCPDARRYGHFDVRAGLFPAMTVYNQAEFPVARDRAENIAQNVTRDLDFRYTADLPPHRARTVQHEHRLALCKGWRRAEEREHKCKKV